MKLYCPHCGVKGSADDSYSGRKVRCPKCQGMFLVQPEMALETIEQVASAPVSEEAAVLQESLDLADLLDHLPDESEIFPEEEPVGAAFEERTLEAEGLQELEADDLLALQVDEIQELSPDDVMMVDDDYEVAESAGDLETVDELENLESGLADEVDLPRIDELPEEVAEGEVPEEDVPAEEIAEEEVVEEIAEEKVVEEIAEEKVVEEIAEEEVVEEIAEEEVAEEIAEPTAVVEEIEETVAGEEDVFILPEDDEELQETEVVGEKVLEDADEDKVADEETDDSRAEDVAEEEQPEESVEEAKRDLGDVSDKICSQCGKQSEEEEFTERKGRLYCYECALEVESDETDFDPDGMKRAEEAAAAMEETTEEGEEGEKPAKLSLWGKIKKIFK